MISVGIKKIATGLKKRTRDKKLQIFTKKKTQNKKLKRTALLLLASHQ
jgi:hypothetical protein